MAAWGHIRPPTPVHGPLAVPQEADHIRAPALVISWVPGRAPCTAAKELSGPANSLDHYVGAGEQRGRNREAEGSCSLEIDRQLELREHLNWKIWCSEASCRSSG